MSQKTKSKSSRRPSERSHRSTLSLQTTDICINVYDLLPVSNLLHSGADLSSSSFLPSAADLPHLQPGRLSSALWTFGSSFLHSAVVIRGREYAYGGHDQAGISGVYWTKPRTEPPGGRFRCEILHGKSIRTDAEIDQTIREVRELAPTKLWPI